MLGRIPENILEDILSRVDIAELISGYLPLKRAGRNFKACCPFHHEKTPSFMVSPDKQIYHCFGCGESGNAFKFLMRHERMEFPEAVEMLAKKAGVALPEFHKQDSASASITTQLYKINELAVNFYENNLVSPEGRFARDYLVKRGLKPETIKAFKIGLAPEKWDGLTNYLRSKHNIGIALLEKAGLILAKDSGGYYDRFRNRIIFPIYDLKSRPLGFGARVLDNSLPKYINSPETQIYTKGRHLYGLNLAKDHIREEDFAVIVEGYLDFIMPYQEGFGNIVASLGTALTTEQARLLKRFTHNVVMVYDPDIAGELATLRSLDIFIEEEMEVRVAVLPQGVDPDSFVRKNGIAKFKEIISGAKSLFDYKLAKLKSHYNSRQIEGKAKICRGMLETLNKINNAVLKSEYIRKLASELDVSQEALLEELKKINSPKLKTQAPDTLERKHLNINPVEKLLIKLMLEETSLINRLKSDLEPADFQDQRTSRIVSVLFDLAGQGRKIEPNAFINSFDKDEEIPQIICEAMFLPEDLSVQDKDRIVSDCVKRLKSNKLKSRRQDLHEQIKAAQDSGDEEGLHKLIEEFHYLIKQG